MPDYATFTVEDFVFDPLFQKWVREALPEDTVYWESWLTKNPDRSADIQLARQLVMTLEAIRPQVTAEFVEQDVQQVLQRVSQQKVEKPRISGHRQATWWLAAASVLVLLGLAWWLSQPTVQESLVRRNPVAAPEQTTRLTRENTTSKPVQVLLPDGSTVTLSPKSRLTYPAVFRAASREVTLSGEAFFSIVRNPEKPFKVYTDEIVTQVLGTSFRVRAFKDDPNLTVAVRTGKVAVYARKDYRRTDGRVVDKRVISLMPNQQADFSRARAEFRKTLVAQPLLVNKRIRAGDFEFDETPATEIFQRIQQAYGVEIIYDAELLRDCNLTASLADESMTDKLHIVCRGIGATYEIVEGAVVIQSTGCK